MKVWELRMQLLLNVLMDTIGYSMFSFIMWTTYVLESRHFLFANWNELDTVFKSYLAGQRIYNRMIDLLPAFFLTFLWVFNKHINGFTADSSKEIYKQIQEINVKKT